MSLSLKVARATVGGRGMPGAGDPGVFGFLGSALKKVTGITKAVPGPIGWASSAVQRIVGPSRPTPQPPAPVRAFAPQRGPMPPAPPRQPTPGIVGVVQRVLPGGRTGYQEPVAPAATGEIGAPAGYHVNKTSYFLKDGTFIPAGTRWVKNRRRNPLNPRAASKAVGRIEALKRATKRFSNITIRKKCNHK